MLQVHAHNPAALHGMLSTIAPQDIERLISNHQASTSCAMEQVGKRVRLATYAPPQPPPQVPERSPSNQSSTIAAYYPATRDVTPESAPRRPPLGNKRSFEYIVAQQQQAQQHAPRVVQRRRYAVRQGPQGPSGRPPLGAGPSATSQLLSHILLTIAAPGNMRTPPAQPIALPPAALAACRAPLGPQQVPLAAYEPYPMVQPAAPRVVHTSPQAYFPKQLPSLLPSIWTNLMGWLPLLNLQAPSSLELAGFMWQRLRRQVLEQGRELYFTPVVHHTVSDSVLIGCLIVAIKLQENRKGCPSLTTVARVIGTTPALLGRLELQALEAVNWRPLLGYKQRV